MTGGVPSRCYLWERPKGRSSVSNLGDGEARLAEAGGGGGHGPNPRDGLGAAPNGLEVAEAFD